MLLHAKASAAVKAREQLQLGKNAKASMKGAQMDMLDMYVQRCVESRSAGNVGQW